VNLDTRVFEIVNQHWTSAALDWWSAVVRATELWFVPAAVTIVLIAWRGTPRVRSFGVLAVLLFALGDGTVARCMKVLTHRARPGAVLPYVRSVRLARVKPRFRALAMPLEIGTFGPKDADAPPRSFPSGHTWSAFSLATLIVLGWRRWGWIAFVPAAMVGVARVHAGLHWPSDVLASAVMAPLFTLAVVVRLERWWRGEASRRWPRALAALPGVTSRAAGVS
jgi:membrane-associated phospholipid phosphatase